MATKRKLFLTHAGELAHLLVTAITRNGKTRNFIHEYAVRYDRAKVIANPERLLEIESTISREALLLLAADVRRLLSKALASPRKDGAQESPLRDLFYAEFLNSLARAFPWPAEHGSEEQMFAKDLEMYTRWREKNAKPSQRPSADAGPFPDRCAILLDPAIMSQARRAALKFQAELLRLGAGIFGRLGRPISQPQRVRRVRPPRSTDRNRNARGSSKDPNSRRKTSARSVLRRRKTR